QTRDIRNSTYREFWLRSRQRSARCQGDVRSISHKTSGTSSDRTGDSCQVVMVAIIEKRDLRDFDWPTALLALTIAAFGVWQIHNAQPTETYWSKQIVGIGIAIVAFLAVAFNDYRRIIDAAPVFYIIGLVMLFLVVTP